MNAITPSGTRTREISRPLGRRQDSTTVPTGSGSAAVSRSPCAISSTRASLSASRSRNARATPRLRARSTSARLASRSAAVFSTSPPAIRTSASFLIFVGQSASVRAASRAARAFASTTARTSMAILENHQVVTVDHFVEALVPQPRLDLGGPGTPDLPELLGVEVHHAARELATARAVHRHDLARGEVALDLDDPRREEALLVPRQRRERARVHRQAPLGRHRESDPALARGEPL